MKRVETDVLIIGAGPVGLFSVFELGQLGMRSCVVDCLDMIGGQCTSLYPQKPIYDIPAYPEISAEQLIEKLNYQIKPFKPEFILGEKVEKFENKNDKFLISTSGNNSIISKCVIIAAGNGAFGPNKQPLENIKDFEKKSIFYHVNDKTIFKKKTIAIAGGGDSAVDWAIELSSITKKIYFIHRRQKLRAAPANVDKLFQLQKQKKIDMVIPYQIDSINGSNGNLENIVVKDLNNSKRVLNIDFFLPFFGLSTDLVPIKDW